MANSRDRSAPALRVLFVDASAAAIKAFKATFAASGLKHRIKAVTDPAEALQLLRTRPTDFDILVTDHKLHGITGLELCLSVIEAGIALPKVLLSNSGSENLAAIALKAGVEDYIVKDPDGGYLELLTVLLPEIKRFHDERIARKQAEEALRDREMKYHLLIENFGAAVAMISHEGRLLVINSMAASFLGGTPEVLTGRSLRDLFPRDIAENYIAGIKAAISQKKSNITEESVALPGGARWFRFNSQPVADELGNAFAIQLIAQDITSQKEAEKALFESEQRFYDTADLLPILIFELDEEGTLIYANRFALGFSGYSPKDLYDGLSLSNLLPESHQIRALDMVHQVMAGNTMTSVEFPMITRDGRPLHVLVDANPLMRGGKCVGVRGVGIDITKRKEAEMEKDTAIALLRHSLTQKKRTKRGRSR